MSVSSLLFALVAAGFAVIWLIDPTGRRSVLKRIERMSDRDATWLHQQLGERLGRRYAGR